jgi:hypothetical protein
MMLAKTLRNVQVACMKNRPKCKAILSTDLVIWLVVLALMAAVVALALESRRLIL